MIRSLENLHTFRTLLPNHQLTNYWGLIQPHTAMRVPGDRKGGAIFWSTPARFFNALSGSGGMAEARLLGCVLGPAIRAQH